MVPKDSENDWPLLTFFLCHCSVYTYESLSNELWVVMRTDETVSLPGYWALWEALPVKKCENKTFRGLNSGYVQSPGYPDEESSRFYQPLDCWTVIQAPSKFHFQNLVTISNRR